MWILDGISNLTADHADDADLLLNKVVLSELKPARTIEQAHLAQLLNYLKATELEVGLVLNFGPKPEFKRVVFGNDRKALSARIY